MPQELDKQIDAIVKKRMGPTLAKLGRSMGRLSGGSAKGRAYAARIEKNLRLSLRKQFVGQQPELIRDLVKNGNAGYVPLKGQGRALLVDRDGCSILGFNKKKIAKPHSSTPTPPITAKDHVKEALQFEDKKNFMYVDTAGHVHVGIGHKIDNENAAANIAFVTSAGAPASKSDITSAYRKLITEFNKIKFKVTLPKKKLHNMAAAYFEKLTTLRLPSQAIKDLYEDDVGASLHQLKYHPKYPDFETFPKEAKIAILDIAFSMGVAGFADTFTNFRIALDNRDWKKAAKQSSRDSVHADRNKFVFDKLMEAYKKEPFYLTPSCKPKELGKHVNFRA